MEVETGIQFAALAGGGAAVTHHDIFELSLSKALQGRDFLFDFKIFLDDNISLVLI